MINVGFPYKKKTLYQFSIGTWLPFTAEIQGTERASGFELLMCYKEIHRKICIESLEADTKLRVFKLTCAI